MSQITPAIVAKVCEARLGTDQNLTLINDAVSSNNINVTEAIEVAVLFGNAVRTRQGVTEQSLADGIVAAFKAAAYKKLQQHGIGFTDDPKLHDSLNNLLTEVVRMIKSSQQASQSSSLTGGLRLGGIGGGGISGGSSLAIDTTPAPTQQGLAIETGGLSLTGAGALPGEVVKIAATVSPLAAIPHTPLVADTNQPMTSPAQAAGILNDPVISPIEEATLESYAEHELEAPKRRISISAKEANDRVTEYAETRDWKEPLEDLVLGAEQAVYFSGADIAVRLRDIKRTFLVGVNADAIERFAEFVAAHDSHIDTMRNIAKQGLDADKVVKLVTQTVKAMKLNAVALYANSTQENDEVTETIVSEAVRFVNAYLGMLTMYVHNGLSLATDRCKEIPGKYKGVQLERSIDDIDFFSDTLYNSTTGENGFTSEPDFFREVFLTVARSVSTLNVKMEGKATVTLVQKSADILIPGSYPTLVRNNMVGKHSLGATQEPVTVIYEYLSENLPDTNTYLVAPQGRYLLLSNGEPTAAILY